MIYSEHTVGKGKSAMKRMTRRLGTLAILFLSLTALPVLAGEIKVAIYAAGRASASREVLYQALKETKGITPEYISAITPEDLSAYHVLVVSLTKYHPKGSGELVIGDKQAQAIKEWVASGKGLLCYNDSVGFARHGSLPLFPEIAKGVANPYPDQEGYAREGIVTRAHPLLEGIPVGTRFVVSYYDYILLEPGPQGTAIVRAVIGMPQGGVIGESLVVCGKVGKGRYVANGMFTGFSAGNQPVAPESVERRLLLNSIYWLAGARPEGPVPSEEKGLVKGTYLPQRNLVLNPSCEIVENGKPVGWGGFVACGNIEWGATDQEKHAGKYSAYIKPTKYYFTDRGEQVGGALLAADTDGYSGPRAMRVKPNTVYRFSFWLKSEIARLYLVCFAWPEEGLGRHLLETSVGRITPAPEWRQYQGQFTTGPDTHRVGLAFHFSTAWLFQIPLQAMVYVDDVEITEGERVSSVRELYERSLVRKTVPWEDTMSRPEVAMERIAAGTPVPMNQAYLALPLYSNLPEGWRRIDLADLWKVKKLEGTEANPADDLGTKDGYWKIEYDDSAWPVRPVPGFWEDSDEPHPPRKGGIGESHGSNVFTGVGWYRHKVIIPGRAKGNRVLLVCEGIADISDIWVNGVKVGHHVGGHVPATYDITEVAKPDQENVIAVRVFDPLQGVREMGGIWGEVYLQFAPPVYARRALVTPRLSASSVEADCWLINQTESPQSISLQARVKSYPTPLAKGPAYDKTVPLGKITLQPGETRRKFTIPLKNPVLWSPTNPFLYVLELKAGQDWIGKTRFGYREFIVKDAYFYLNGRRAEWLRGVQFHLRTFNLEPRITVYNEANFMKRYLSAYKSYRGNMLYPMTSTYPRQFYDMCDELGIMIYDEWDSGGRILPRNTPVESEPGLGEIDCWVYTHYNHPCIVMRSLGGELFENYKPAGVSAYKEILDPVYARVKSLDLQNRPVCPSSGKHLWVDGDQTDFCDFHFYPGGIDGAWVNEQPLITRIRERMLAMYGREMPLIQFEFSGLGRYYGFTQEDNFLRANRYQFTADGTWDKQAFIKLVEREPDWWLYTRGLTGLHGLRAYLAGNEKWEWYGVAPQKRTIKNAIEDARRCGDLLQGIAPYLDGYEITEVLVDGKILDNREYGRGRLDGDLNERVFVTSEAYQDLRRVWNPRFVCLDVFDQNVFAGKQLQATVYAMNDTPEISGDWSIRAVLRAPEGKRLADHTAALGKVEPFKYVLVPYSCLLPADLKSGFYRLELFLSEKGKVISDNDYQVFVLGRKDQEPGITSSKKIALYDTGEKFLGTEGMTTAKILDALHLKYDRIGDFSGLDKYQVLIIGAFSFDPVVTAGGGQIQGWLEKGGRLLSFEQMMTGAIPFLPQLQIVRNHPNILTELVAIEHPVFQGLRPENFDRWNGTLPEASVCPGAVFVNAISPLNETVVASGCTDTPRNTTKAIQMTVSEVKVGAGIALFSQLEATRRYGSDSVATKYLQNALAHILSDETRYSTQLPALSLGEPDMSRCGLVDLSPYGTGIYGKEKLDWLADVSGGRREYRGITFHVPEKAVILAYAGKIEDIPVGRSLLYDEKNEQEFLRTHHDFGPLQPEYIETLYFLHGSDRVQPGELVARYILHYADGTSAEFKVVGGLGIANHQETKDLPAALVAGNGLLVTVWDNPSPQKKVRSLDLVCTGKGNFVLGGITCKLIRAKVHD